MKMFTIGEFSKITKVPVKTIRYYQEIGLLKPAEVDKITGYRRFDEKNIDDLLKIIYLKELGFKLAEIKNFDKNSFKRKAREFKERIKKIRKNISDISTLYKNEKGEVIMKNFINDEKLVGRWQLVGLADNKEDLNNLYKPTNFGLNQLTFLPNGEKYWVVTFWTKDHIFIKDVPMKYFYEKDNLVIAFDYDVSNNPEFYAVYKNLDHKEWTKDEIGIKDDIDKDFIKDDNLKGVWETCGFVKEIADFNKNINQKGKFLYKNLLIWGEGSMVVVYSDNMTRSDNMKWTKGYIMNILDKTAQSYVIKEIDGQKYMFMEHKSGDYTYGGLKPYYYVFKKVD